MAHGHHLTDRAAHRCADDVRRRHTGMIEHGDGIVGHLLDRVHAERLVAASCAAVVERDHAVAASQREALHVPAVLVGAEALDHQHRGRAAPAECLVVKTSAVGGAGVAASAFRQPIDGGDPGVQPTETVDQSLDVTLRQLSKFELGERSAALAGVVEPADRPRRVPPARTVCSSTPRETPACP